MRDNLGFILTFSAMMVTIALLHGCTQFDKTDSDKRDIDILVTPVPEGGCIVKVGAENSNSQEDSTVELTHPTGG